MRRKSCGIKIRRREVSVCVPICLICAICLTVPGMGNRDKIAYGQVADGENSAGMPEKEQQPEAQQPTQRRTTVSASGINWSLSDADAVKLLPVLEAVFMQNLPRKLPEKRSRRKPCMKSAFPRLHRMGERRFTICGAIGCGRKTERIWL